MKIITTQIKLKPLNSTVGRDRDDGKVNRTHIFYINYKHSHTHSQYVITWKVIAFRVYLCRPDRQKMISVPNGNPLLPTHYHFSFVYPHMSNALIKLTHTHSPFVIQFSLTFHPYIWFSLIHVTKTDIPIAPSSTPLQHRKQK